MEQAVLPISGLSKYQAKRAMKVHTTNKAQLRKFSKGSGEGNVFGVDPLDAEGGEIKASFFNQAVDKFHDMLEKGTCFTFSRGSIQIASKQYNPTNYRHELTVDKDVVVEIAQDDSTIDAMKFSFVNFRSLQARSLPCTIDICGIITSFRPTQSVNRRDSKELVKRKIVPADDSATSMTVTLWASVLNRK